MHEQGQVFHSLQAPSSEWSHSGAAYPQQETPEQLFARILMKLRQRDPNADLSKVEKAYEMACKAHHGQKRRSGEAYLMHPLRVAETMIQLGLGVASVAASLLHDSVEDSELSVFDLTEVLGEEIAKIVDGVTKIGKVPYLSRREQQAESFRKMLLAMSQDIRVLLVKLADRLDNMRTLEHMPVDKQQRISRETVEIYAPLAHRLGIQWIRRELENRSFSYLEPTLYNSLRQQITSLEAQNPNFREQGVKELQEVFASSAKPVEQPGQMSDDGMIWSEAMYGPVHIRTQIRNPYQAHCLSIARACEIDSLSKLVVYEIITANRASAYQALGLLHSRFQLVPGRFRDHIALPRPNHYQSLHTTVINRHGTLLEIQIRSKAMDEVANQGIVSTLQRRDPTHGQSNDSSRWRSWFSQLMDWQEDVSDPHEFIEAVKSDLFADEVYVFTPAGDIHTFCKGSTPIDFAFAIHSDVGLHCSGSRVNGQIVPLRYQLRQGDTVEILTTPTTRPRREWLKMCRSSRAKAHIKQFLRQEERQRLRNLGKSLLEQELATRGKALVDYEKNQLIAAKANELGLRKELQDQDGVYEALGLGLISVTQVCEALVPESVVKVDSSNLLTRMLRRMSGKNGEPQASKGSRKQRNSHGFLPYEGGAGAPIIVTQERVQSQGSSLAMIQLATCCSPVPGDPLIGYFVPGKGIVAHVENCPTILDQIDERRVYLVWSEQIDLSCSITLEVRTANSVGLLAEMSRVFSHHGVNIIQANCRALDQGLRAINTFHVMVQNAPQLDALIQTLRQIEGVQGVERVFTESVDK